MNLQPRGTRTARAWHRLSPYYVIVECSTIFFCVIPRNFDVPLVNTDGPAIDTQIEGKVRHAMWDVGTRREALGRFNPLGATSMNVCGHSPSRSTHAECTPTCIIRVCHCCVSHLFALRVCVSHLSSRVCLAPRYGLEPARVSKSVAGTYVEVELLQIAPGGVSNTPWAMLGML